MIYPTIDAWKKYVNSLQTEKELNGALSELRRGERTTCGIHNFKLENKMGLAIWYLNQRAEKLEMYRLRTDGTYRKK